MMRFFWFLLVFLLFSCDESDNNQLSGCVQEKLIRFGEGELKIKDAEFLELNYSMVCDRAGSHGFKNSVLLSDYDCSAILSSKEWF